MIGRTQRDSENVERRANRYSFGSTSDKQIRRNQVDLSTLADQSGRSQHPDRLAGSDRREEAGQSDVLGGDKDRIEVLGPLCQVERNFAVIVLAARTSDLVFVDQVRSINSNPFDNRKFIALVAAKCFRHESIVIPMTEARRG